MRWREHCKRAGRLGLFVASLAAGACAVASEPRFNQLQVIGSHNSYHIAPAAAIQQLLASRNPQRAAGARLHASAAGRAILEARDPAGRAGRLRRSQGRALRHARGPRDRARAWQRPRRRP